jgi:hypothetical protein
MVLIPKSVRPRLAPRSPSTFQRFYLYDGRAARKVRGDFRSPPILQDARRARFIPRTLCFSWYSVQVVLQRSSQQRLLRRSENLGCPPKCHALAQNTRRSRGLGCLPSLGQHRQPLPRSRLPPAGVLGPTLYTKIPAATVTNDFLETQNVSRALPDILPSLVCVQSHLASTKSYTRT